MTRIGVAYESGAGERRATIECALAALGDVIPLPADEHLASCVVTARPDIVVHVPGLRQSSARRLHVAAFLECYGIPFLGSDALTQATCLQRARMKETLAYHGIATPDFAVVERREQLAAATRLGFPLSLRHARAVYTECPSRVVHDAHELAATVDALLAEAPDAPLIVERVLAGDAFACTLLGNAADLIALPLLTIGCGGAPDAGSASGIGRARRAASRVSEGLGEEIVAIATRVWYALGLRDMARVDVQLTDDGRPSVCGVDSLPSLTDDDPETTLLAAARAAGLDDHELVQRCLLIAAQRAGVEVPRAPRFSRLPRRTPPGGIRAPLLS